MTNNSQDFLSTLNEPQREAVLYTEGPQLVIAGAGSGKTRVLTYKIAYLLQQGLKPWEIMALTFTNKAAREMKERIASIVGMDRARHLFMGTFHSLFARILRTEAQHIGYTSGFTIYDESDSRSLIKSIVKELGLDDKVYKPSEVHNRISAAKNRLITARQYSATEFMIHDSQSRKSEIYRIYALYDERCRASNAMDFDDLLLNTYLLFSQHADVLEKYSTTLRYFLVDEYQDTNFAQQRIISQLTTYHHNVCVVGDDAQSIYGFRGADIDNILDFQQQYAEARLFKLEQNYRSTQRIVLAANSLIKKNRRQIEKNVFSKNEEGDKIKLMSLASDREEAAFVAEDIRRVMLKNPDTSPTDFAILYRTNYQSRTFEEQFMKSNMPYTIYGGLSFYQRKEIKDVIAYFRLIVNHNDEEAFRRIVNYPTRGIGDTTQQKILIAAHASGQTLWDTISYPEMTGLKVNRGTLSKLTAFRIMIEEFAARLDNDDAFSLAHDLVKQSGISQDIYSSSEPEYKSKQENVEELLSSIQDFVETAREEDTSTRLTDFLNDVSLLGDREEKDDGQPKITLMTIHSAKGLEFPYVYVVGMEENVFPSQMSVDSPRELEEERRLLYVAITRAERRCTLSCARTRYRYGKMEFDSPSRFLRDIDPKYLSASEGSFDIPDYATRRPRLFGSMSGRDENGNADHLRTNGSHGGYATRQQTPRPQPIRPVFGSMEGKRRVSSTPQNAVSDSVPSLVSQAGGFAVGDSVMHERFGRGSILELSGTGSNVKARVIFDSCGEKQLLLKFARLTKV